jgi:hypothetical protein
VKYIIDNQSTDLAVGSIIQSNSSGRVYIIVYAGNEQYGLLQIEFMEIIDYNDCMIELVKNNMPQGYTILTQEEPIKLVRGV